MESPNYVKNLLKPNGQKPAGRKVWSIDLETIWLPFLTATNAQGDTALPYDALGAPLRLAYQPDGSVKFSNSGRPIIKVAKPIAEAVKLVRDNFTAGLVAYANGVAMESPEAYRQQVELARQAGKPIVDMDRQALQAALASLEAQAEVKPQAEVKSKPKASVKATPKPKVKPKPEAKPEAQAEAEAKPEADKVLVPA